MNTRAVATEYRLAQWAQTMAERSARGQSVQEFCVEKEISKNTYFYWQRKLREAACRELLPATAQVESAPVVPEGWTVCEEASVKADSTPTPEVDANGLCISIGKFRVVVGTPVDPEQLATVCRVLVSLC